MKNKPTDTAAPVRAWSPDSISVPSTEDDAERKETQDNPNIHRIIELDTLRGIAILLVIGRHVLDIPETLTPLIRHTFLIWREVGWIGIDLFFVLSGFLVSR